MASWDDRAQAFEERPFWTAFKYGLGLCLLVLAIMAVLTPFNAGFAWLSEGAKLTGPQHSADQTTSVLDDWNSMIATAGNACDAVESSKSSPDDPLLVERPDFAYRATYRRIEADYDRRMSNFFEAALTRKLPIPNALHGYPRRAPTLAEAEKRQCPSG